jgi:heme-degrading monooxygenase HmoA
MWIRSWIVLGACLLITTTTYCQTSVYQLRIYKLHPGNEQHFHDRFSRQCMPIMRGYDFDIVFTSQSGEPSHKEFVYLIRWRDRETQASAWKKFLADPEWIKIKKTTTAQWGDLVDDVQDRSLDMLPYTPRPSLVPEHGYWFSFFSCVRTSAFPPAKTSVSSCENRSRSCRIFVPSSSSSSQ